MINKGFWSQRKVFLTGHTGFKGSWLTVLFDWLGTSVCGYSLRPYSEPNLFRSAGLESLLDQSIIGDINDAPFLESSLQAYSPDIIIHFAAQPLVRASYKDPIETFKTNVIGTANILYAASRLKVKPKAILVITTDKVYKNDEFGYPFRETDVLGGSDPYSSSKACAEIITQSMYSSFFKDQGVSVATARAGNVIGGGDWSSDRLIPDLIRSWQSSTPLVIRNPTSIRPWQHVLEPLCAYLRYIELISDDKVDIPQSMNFGPEPSSCLAVNDLLDFARSIFDFDLIIDSSQSHGMHEAQLLRLDTTLLTDLLGVRSRWDANETLSKTLMWYDGFYKNRSALALCRSNIEDFCSPFEL